MKNPLRTPRVRDLMLALHEQIGETGVRALLGQAAPVLVSKAVKSYVHSLRDNRLSERHISTVSTHLARLAQQWPESQVGQIDEAGLTELLTSISSPKTRKNYRISFIAFFRWMQRKGWLPEGRRTAAERTEVPKCAVAQPEIFSPDEMRRLLTVDEWPVRTFLVLGGFAGIRSAEIQRMRWSDWSAANESLTLGPDITKTARRRIVSAGGNLHEWLTLMQPHDGADVKPMTFAEPRLRAILARHCEKVGVQWKPNALRHSYASYHLELFGNAILTSKNMGNSPSMMETVYLQLTNKRTAEEWFAIRPQ